MRRARWALGAAVLAGLALPLPCSASSAADGRDRPTPTTTAADVPHLLADLANPDALLRIHAYQELTALGPAVRARLVSTLVDDLSAADPSVRDSAVHRLMELGPAAHDAVKAAAAGGTAEVRAAAARVLLNRKWVQPGDVSPVPDLLSDYSRQDVESRCQIVRRLSRLTDGIGQAALLRILQDDPTAAVRWQAADSLCIQHGDVRPPLQQLRAMAEQSAATRPNGPGGLAINPVDSANAPLLAAFGWAERSVDPDRAAALLNRAIALDAAHPAALEGELDFAFRWLTDRAVEMQDEPEAQRLLRQQLARGQDSDDAEESSALADAAHRLLALHANHGPLPGLSQDLHLCQRELLSGPGLYAISKIADRRGQPLAGRALRVAAALASGASPSLHLEAGTFCAEQGWLSAAQRELHLALLCNALSLPPTAGVGADDEAAANIYFQLARVAAEQNDELAVAHAMERAVSRLGGHDAMRTTTFGDTLPYSNAQAWAEVHWHYLRAARSAHDVPAMQLHLQKLLALNQLQEVLHRDPGLAVDIVPALAETGHTADANHCFDAAYADLQASIRAKPDDPDAKNDLAWLCARCDRHLDEAVRLADAAVAAAPATAAYLDTDAEAHFRMHQPAVAAALEARAVQLQPGDVFMQQQLERFRAAAATQPVRE